jgi:hypothetical protein
VVVGRVGLIERRLAKEKQIYCIYIFYLICCTIFNCIHFSTTHTIPCRFPRVEVSARGRPFYGLWRACPALGAGFQTCGYCTLVCTAGNTKPRPRIHDSTRTNDQRDSPPGFLLYSQGPVYHSPSRDHNATEI